MGPPSYMRSVVDRNVVMRRIPVQCFRFTALTRVWNMESLLRVIAVVWKGRDRTPTEHPSNGAGGGCIPEYQWRIQFNALEKTA
jgi:hypothetical protein